MDGWKAAQSRNLYTILTILIQMERQRIALLGSTGSIGVQTLDIVRENSSLFEITTLTAHKNWQQLAAQAVEFNPDSVVIADERYYKDLSDALAAYPIKVYAGNEAVAQVAAADNVDVVVCHNFYSFLQIFVRTTTIPQVRENIQRFCKELSICYQSYFHSLSFLLFLYFLFLLFVNLIKLVL